MRKLDAYMACNPYADISVPLVICWLTRSWARLNSRTISAAFQNADSGSMDQHHMKNNLLSWTRTKLLCRLRKTEMIYCFPLLLIGRNSWMKLKNTFLSLANKFTASELVSELNAPAVVTEDAEQTPAIPMPSSAKASELSRFS